MDCSRHNGELTCTAGAPARHVRGGDTFQFSCESDDTTFRNKCSLLTQGLDRAEFKHEKEYKFGGGKESNWIRPTNDDDEKDGRRVNGTTDGFNEFTRLVHRTHQGLKAKMDTFEQDSPTFRLLRTGCDYEHSSDAFYRVFFADYENTDKWPKPDEFKRMKHELNVLFTETNVRGDGFCFFRAILKSKNKAFDDSKKTDELTKLIEAMIPKTAVDQERKKVFVKNYTNGWILPSLFWGTTTDIPMVLAGSPDIMLFVMTHHQKTRMGQTRDKYSVQVFGHDQTEDPKGTSFDIDTFLQLWKTGTLPPDATVRPWVTEWMQNPQKHKSVVIPAAIVRSDRGDAGHYHALVPVNPLQLLTRPAGALTQ